MGDDIATPALTASAPSMDEPSTDSKTDAPVGPKTCTEEPTSGKAVKHKVSKSQRHGRRKDCAKHSRKAKKSHRRASVSSESSSQSSSSSDQSSTTSASSSVSRRQDSVKKSKHARSRRSRKAEASSSESDDSESDSDSDDRRKKSRKGKGKKSRRAPVVEEDDEEEDEAEEEADSGDAKWNRKLQKAQDILQQVLATAKGGKKKAHKAQTTSTSRKRHGKRGSMLEFKRLDNIWDSQIHDYRLRESAEDEGREYDEYVFIVKRSFDYDGKYRSTAIEIKSKYLKDVLAEVLKDVKSVSVVEDEPSIDPNMLFLYLDELRAHCRVLKSKAKAERRGSRARRKFEHQRDHAKVLVKYLDEDYEQVKKTLFPLLKAGNITFDLLWALFKPNTIAFTSTYGSSEHPRCFKVDYANKETHFIKGEWYCVEGRYLEYDGKNYGLGEFEVNVESFKGPRKITSLATYPLQYHRDPQGITKQLVERGKTFVSLEGMNYKFHKGLAFQKRKKTVAKVNINGRVMIDPAIFRRVNANYQISFVRAKEEEMEDDDDDDASGCSCGGSDDESDDDRQGVVGGDDAEENGDAADRTRYQVVFDKKGNAHVVEVDRDGQIEEAEKLDLLSTDESGAKPLRSFTEEELLIASPVVLGFAFAEKLWLEFSLSGIRDIEWDAHAFEALVLPSSQKMIVKALVESHKFHAAKTIDDVIQGKGKGLVSVLHGPPGTGKTLTAEGIAELLKVPLYMVSAGELGTDPARLEHELQKILDVAHSWGAVLLLDEADIFLERRELHDIHRNALVSVFLRLLEYFQGILFLTTNRVETFDEAIQSRVHVALRYSELDAKARKEVWKMFIEKCRAVEGVETAHFRESDFTDLARREMNGRQIKNIVRTAQALAVNEQEKLTMDHIKQVIEVAEKFNRDLKGGPGFAEAMHSYT